ncbi:hypothetical protein OSTOST_22062, partial [Ostertagia ostertagi]
MQTPHSRKLTLEERFVRGSLMAMEKIEDRLRQFQRQVQSAKLDVANAQQKTMNNIAHERSAHQACLDRLEDLQRENFALMQSRYLESGCDDSVWQRKIDALPAYEALYSFAQHAVRKYSDLRWMLLEREREASRAELDLIAAQSSLLVTHAQNERFRIKLGEKRPKRPASFHGEDLLNRVVKRDMNFFLPFKMQGSRVENSRRILNKKSLDNEKDLESEFFAVFDAPPPTSLEKPPTAVSRIEYMMREMSQNKNRKAPLAPVRENPKSSANRPIRPIDTGQVPTSSLQELPFHSPGATPVSNRKFPEKVPFRLYDQLPEKMKVERVRQLERGYSMETHDRPTYSEEMRRLAEERKRDERERVASNEEAENRKSRIQRQPPVHLTRIRPPSYVIQRKT